MNDISSKFSTIPQLEVILKSIDLEHSSELEPILNSKEVDTQEKEDIRKYLKLIQLTANPSVPLLQKEIPGRNWEDVEPIEREMLSDYILLYLYNKKNLEASKDLIELSSKVRSTGLTEDVVDRLTKLTKSDAVTHKFTNIKDSIVDRYEDDEYSAGIPTGINFVDEMTGGIHKGEVSTVTAFAGHGKTTLSLNIAYNALTLGQNVLYMSLEVPKDYIYFDLISRHSNNSKFKMRIPHFELKKRKLKPEKWDYVKSTILPDLNDLPGKIYVADETEFDNYSQYTLESKFREIDKLATEETGHGIDVVFIDHVQLLKFNSGRVSNSTGDVINEHISWFRQMAMDWLKTKRQVAFVCLSQTNRAGYEYARDNNGKYGATAMAEANELERASALILTVYAESEMKDLGMAKVQVLKYRDSRNEDEPTEVNIDLQYYLFGDNANGVTGISSNISDETTEAIMNNEEGNGFDILSELGEFMGNSEDFDI